MIVDITEDEREYLERMCTISELFEIFMHGKNDMGQLNALCDLKSKLRSLDSNLINKIVEGSL